MSVSERISPLIGRLAIAWFFLSEAWTILHAWDGTVTLMQMRHIEFAAPLLVVALVVMILGGLSIALGYNTKYGAVLLFGFTVVVTMLMGLDYEIFVRNVAIAGGLLVLIGVGPGAFAIDNSGKKKSH